jgi:hypothetical protein
MNITLQPETKAHLTRPTPGTVAWQSQNVGLEHGEPLVLILDGLLRYAKAHAARYGSPVAEDYVLGKYWLEALQGIHGLLDGAGAVALERNRTTDSKDNGVCEAIYWDARDAAGFPDESGEQ